MNFIAQRISQVAASPLRFKYHSRPPGLIIEILKILLDLLAALQKFVKRFAAMFKTL